MKATIVNQYSVFLMNEPGALEKFAKIIFDAGLDILGISSDIRYDAAIVKFVTSQPEGEEIDANRIITKAGYTSIKTDVICIEGLSQSGAMMKIGGILGSGGINITTIYGSSIENAPSRLYLAVDNVEKAVAVLNTAQD